MIDLSKNIAKIAINRYKPIDCVKVIFVHNLTAKEFEFSGLENISQSVFFYEFELDLSGILDGEYTVHLYDADSNEIGSPLLAVCGEYKKNVNSYQKQNNKIVYERD